MTAVKYYTFSRAKKLANIDGVLPGGDTKNPLFNFPNDFFQNMQAISTDELGRSVPYISLKTVDLNGEVIDDLNLSFFFKGIDFNNISQGNRHGDRPQMSVKSLSLKTTLAYGYLYYTDVVFTLKVHAPLSLAQSTITSLIFPGMPHVLEYGWNSPDKWLNDQRAKMLFQVQTYDLNVNEVAEVELVVKGKALNENFNNAYVGDTGDEVKTSLISEKEADTINESRRKVEAYVAYLKEAKRSEQYGNDYKLVKKLATSYKTVEKKTRGPIAKEFKRRKKVLSDLAVDGNVTLHEVVHSLCDGTFKALVKAWPNVGEFRFIYGDINETVGNTNLSKSLADFPINLEWLNASFKKFVSEGQTVLTVQHLLNLLANDFLENEDIWKNLIKEGSAFNAPDIVINFSNRNGPGSEGIMEVVFHDAKHGIPNTTANLPDGNASSEEAKKKVIGSFGLPVLKLGHVNSFVKKLSLSQISNQAIRAVFLERMASSRVTTVRSDQPQSNALKAVPVTPLTLPLRGNAEVLGHPEWKVQRALFLEAGIFLIDGVYKIMEVDHRLSADGYTTHLVLMYN